MSMNSVMYNGAAASALLNLNRTNADMAQVQERLNTGFKVATAKDNASSFAIAFGMRSDVSTFKAIKENVGLGESIVNSSLAVANQIGKEVQKIKDKIAQAADQPQGRDLIQQDIDNSIAQIKSFVGSATFNGINLLDGVAALKGEKFSVTASLDRNADGDPTLSSFSFDYHDLTISNSARGLGDLLNMDVDRATPLENDTSSTTRMKSTLATVAANDVLTFTYLDADGKTQELKYTAATAVEADEAAAFVAAHKETLATAGITATSAAGVITFERVEGSGVTIVGFTSDGGTALAADVTNVEEMDLDFSGRELKLGDELTFTYKIGGTERTTTLRVSESDTGTEIATDVFSLKLSDVSAASGATATTIAQKVEAALLASDDFHTAAAAGAVGTGTIMVADDGAGKVTLTTVAENNGDGTATNAQTVAKVEFKAGFNDLLVKADEAEQHLKSVMGALGSASRRLESQREFVDTMMMALNKNISTLVDADMAEEAARLQAIQTRQQLGIQALSIANQGPQAILALFR